MSAGNLLEPVLRQARRRPSAPAVSGPDGDATYGELVARAAALAQAYRDRGVKAGDRVLLLLPPGREAVAAALAAFLVRASYLPVDPALPPARVEGMRQRAKPRLSVCMRPAIDWVTPAELAGGWPVAGAALTAGGSPADLAGEVAYVVHTSGSTGHPKGVEIEHRSVANLLSQVDSLAPLPDGYTGSWWCSPDFDAAVWEMWAPLVRGGRLVVVPPEDRWEGPRVAAFLDAAGVASAHLPAAFLPDLYDRLRTRPESGATLRRLLVGVEPIPLGILQDILRLRADLAILNGYGPAETTICCTLYRVPASGGDPTARTPIGRAVPGNELTVVAADGRPSATGPGELVVSGVSVARGYVGASAEDERRFGPVPGHDSAERGYRTGDLVRVDADGQLVYLGRVDRQLKIRGHRIEPGEVESALRRVAAVRDVVVDGRELPGTGPVVVAYVVREPGVRLDVDEVRRRLRELLPVYAVPSAVVPIDAIPLTTNGKTDRDALATVPLPVITAGPVPDAAGPVLSVWASVLGWPVDPDTDFVGLGGTSLAAARVAALLRRSTGRPVSAAQVLSAASARDLAAALAATDDPAARPAPAERTGATRGPLTSNQIGLLVHDQMSPGGHTSLVPLWYELPDDVDLERLSSAVNRAIAAHRAFGAVVTLDGAEPALVLGRHDVHVTVADAEPDPLAPFDVERGPLMRCVLTRPGTARRRWRLLLAWHHLVVDGWSVRLFLDDIADCYRRPDHVPAPAAWTVCDANTRIIEVARGSRPRGRAAAAALADVAPLAIGADRNAGPVRQVRLPGGLVQALWRTVRAAGVPAHGFLSAAYQRALTDTLGVTEFLMGCAVNGRTRPEFEHIAGYFVDTVLVRAGGHDARAAAAELERARSIQDGVPFADLASRLRGHPGYGAVQLPQVYFSVDDDYLLDLDGVPLDPLPFAIQRARFPAALALRTTLGSVTGVFEYQLGLLSPAAADALLDAFEQHLTALVTASAPVGYSPPS